MAEYHDSASPKYCIVQYGDTLSAIARHWGTTYQKLASANSISNPNLIYVNQKIVYSSTGSKESSSTYNNKPSSTSANTVTIQQLCIQEGTERTVAVAWTWSKRTNTENYKVEWYYLTANGTKYQGSSNTVTDELSTVFTNTYTPPDNAAKVQVYVKPIAKTHIVNKKETAYFTADWSSVKSLNVTQIPKPSTPSTPTVTLTGYKLEASVDNIDPNMTQIEFQVVKDNSKVCKTSKVTVSTAHAGFSCSVSSGAEYKVRCRGLKGAYISDWSEYSSGYKSPPARLSGFTECKAASETSVRLAWSVAPATGETYRIQYATDKRYFEGSDALQEFTVTTGTSYEKTGLSSGEKYFFRIRRESNSQNSEWSGISSVILGEIADPPTTWSTTTTAIAGDNVTLYWVHNSKDGSNLTVSEVEVKIGTSTNTYTITNSDPDTNTGMKTISTPSEEGTKIYWRVRTKGVVATYSNWSMLRTIDVYAQPILTVSMTDEDDNDITEISDFPIYMSAEVDPNDTRGHHPIGYYVSVIANQAYDTNDDAGKSKHVRVGEVVYSKSFDVSNDLLVEFTPHNISLVNNVTYTFKCVVTMNSGLTASGEKTLQVIFDDDEYQPNMEISVNEENDSVNILPYCEDLDGNRVTSVYLSVYRREFDGGLTEIASDLDGAKGCTVIDPHPALDYARYRIVAKDKSTGHISYYDPPSYPIGEKAIILQWDEEWSNYINDSESALAEETWSGSFIRLPYNVDVSENNNIDVSLVEYIGRKHPVSYYGTQLGQTASWNVDIDKKDAETIYALRRLAIWAGNVYVREPSGSGYWAKVSVSFSQTHCEVTVPVSLDITRVEGGI